MNVAQKIVNTLLREAVDWKGMHKRWSLKPRVFKVDIEIRRDHDRRTVKYFLGHPPDEVPGYFILHVPEGSTERESITEEIAFRIFNLVQSSDDLRPGDIFESDYGNFVVKASEPSQHLYGQVIEME